MNRPFRPCRAILFADPAARAASARLHRINDIHTAIRADPDRRITQWTPLDADSAIFSRGSHTKVMIYLRQSHPNLELADQRQRSAWARFHARQLIANNAGLNLRINMGSSMQPFFR